MSCCDIVWTTVRTFELEREDSRIHSSAGFDEGIVTCSLTNTQRRSSLQKWIYEYLSKSIVTVGGYIISTCGVVLPTVRFGGCSPFRGDTFNISLRNLKFYLMLFCIFTKRCEGHSKSFPMQFT